MKSLKASAGVTRAYFAPDGDGVLCLLSKGDFELRSLESGEIKRTWPATPSARMPYAVHRESSMVAVPTKQRTIRFHSLGSNQAHAETEPTKEFPGEPEEALRLAFSSSGALLAVAYTEQRLARVYGTSTAKLIAELPGGVGGHSVVAFSPNQQYLVLAAYDASARVYNVQKKELIASFTDLPMALFALAFAPDSWTFYAGSADGRLYRFRVGDREPEILAEKLKANLMFLQVLPNGKLLSAESDPDSVKLPVSLRLWTIAAKEASSAVIASLPRTPSYIDVHPKNPQLLLSVDGSSEILLHTIG